LSGEALSHTDRGVRTLLLALLFAGCAHPLTTVWVVRHAEKAQDQGDDPPLTEKGAARAQLLAKMLARIEPAAIYATEWRRTKETVEPLAKLVSVPIEAVGAKETDALAKKITSAHEGETVVVAGHSNTVNRLIAALGGPSFPDLQESDYDSLFVVTICGSRAKLETLRIEVLP
jgi:broad specificity phosphatase PhoE